VNYNQKGKRGWVGVPKPLGKTTHEQKKNSVYPKTVSLRREILIQKKFDHQSDF